MRLAQVFSNLLDNAAKYMDRGGHIWLTAVRDGGDIVVTDGLGVGILQRRCLRFFDMFAQVESLVGEIARRVASALRS